MKAAQSNEELHRAMEVHIANLRVLSQPLDELQKTLPSSADIPRCEMLSCCCFDEAFTCDWGLEVYFMQVKSKIMLFSLR